MKTIIALYGPSNTGKTNTLNYLIEKMLDSTDEVIDRNKRGEDRRVYISYNNKEIAITTAGDNGDEIKQNIKFFKDREDRDFDILVTATKTKGCTCQILSAYAEEIKTDINWIKKNTAKLSIDLINQAQAEDIKSFIDSIIG